MVRKNNLINKIIIFSILFFAFGGIIGYLIGSGTENSQNNLNKFNLGSTFPQQLDEQTKSEIILFFENTSDVIEIDKYCQENPMYCIEYCRTINPSDNVCNNMTENFKGEIPKK